jgi:hypothetical protein
MLKTVTGRLWTYVRDDRPFGGSDPPAAKLFYSRERGAASALASRGWAGILQADAREEARHLSEPPFPRT